MDLHFHSLSELTEFLEWVDARRMRNTLGPEPSTADEPSPAMTATIVAEAVQAADAVSEALSGHDDGSEAGAEPAKRKRRTKAEMEAARAAEQTPAVETKTYTDGTTATGTAPLPDQSPVQQASNPFASLLGADGTPAPADLPEAKPAAQPDVAAVAVALGEVSATDHLNKCREYIAKHGLAEYNKTFEKAGLTANVLAFTGEQRALHAATLAA